MTRREMREHCFKMLFGADFYPTGETAGQMEQYFNSPQEDDVTPEGVEMILHQVEMLQEDQEYLMKRVERMASRIPELDEKLNQVAEGWKTRRMGKVELTILRQALFEMQFDDEVPEKVAINEAVDLAKKFGGKESPSFINGVLAKLVTVE
ncbi:MAG: transcription antitermination factor NusB [Lachnospiraceae bacterium]